jgi:hypothetical protein
MAQIDKELYRMLMSAQVRALNPDTPEEELRQHIIRLIDFVELQGRVIAEKEELIEMKDQLIDHYEGVLP